MVGKRIGKAGKVRMTIVARCLILPALSGKKRERELEQDRARERE